MNGEIQQMSAIVCCARRALYSNTEVDFIPSKFVTSIRFIFRSTLTFWRTTEADSVQKWFDICKKRGLCDIRFIIPTASAFRHLLGFANTSQGIIACYYKSGRVTYFVPAWTFDKESGAWDVIYWEQRTKLISSKITDHPDKVEEFKSVLVDIAEFASKIKCSYFSDVFMKAYNGLCDPSMIDKQLIPEYIPDEVSGIYYAIVTADVFGAMGSWNDSPPCYAEEMGLTREYNILSDRLLEQIRYHLMHVTEQCR